MTGLPGVQLPAPPPDAAGASAAFIGFAHALRAAGLPVTPGRTQTFLAACTRLGAGQRESVYWAGRATLCAGPGDLPVYDKTFARWFSPNAVRVAVAAPPARTAVQLAPAEGGGADADADADAELAIAVLASDEEVLRHRDIAELGADERRRLARLFDSLHVRVPHRRAVRRSPARRGEVDPARTVREQLRHAGEPGRLHYRAARQKPRRIVFLVDVSGSMEPYADSLLRLAHRVVAAAPHTTEVFTLGTSLTRVTVPLRLHDVERALRLAGEDIPDWSGGTRLGQGLQAFLNQWGQRGIARQAVVVIASDGWEVGDTTLLAQQMQRLRRLARRVIWSNPHTGKAGYAPVQSGIVAALPSVDALVAGHSLAAFAQVLEVMADA